MTALCTSSYTFRAVISACVELCEERDVTCFRQRRTFASGEPFETEFVHCHAVRQAPGNVLFADFSNVTSEASRKDEYGLTTLKPAGTVYIRRPQQRSHLDV